jgi:hypothetical protein
MGCTDRFALAARVGPAVAAALPAGPATVRGVAPTRRAALARLAAAGMGGWCVLAVADAPQAADAALRLWRERFAGEVDHRLDVPPEAQQRYLQRLQQALQLAGIAVSAPQAFVLVDRSAQVQAAMVVLRTPDGRWSWLGAAAVSTGKTGSFEHFLTPLGVFAHALDNPDFRAEGTFNQNHIRGYGARGRRVFDFGWQLAERGWGKGGSSRMRLQMHATDPQRLEQRLGRVASEGCIRIPAMLNVFLDRHAVLDADYEQAQAAGQPLWVLGRGREPLPWPGRYLVIVDSQAAERPAWSPLPGAKPTVRSAPAAAAASAA